MEVLQNPLRKLNPVRASSASLGISSRSQPGSSGQCRGWRCWSVISSRRLGGRIGGERIAAIPAYGCSLS
jgi:hypothetical protein